MKRLITLLALAGILSFAATAAAGVPQLMNYQGRLTDDTGNPLDTTVSITFTIYDDSTGGPQWSELHPSVSVVDGLFSVTLGRTHPIEVLISDSAKWLGIKIGDDPEIEPRTQFVTVPNAFRVSTIDGATGGIISGDVSIQADESDVMPADKHPGLPKVLVGTGFTIFGMGRPSSVHLDDGANGIGIDLDGLTPAIGIGTATMDANLDVKGSIYTRGGTGDANGDGSTTIADMAFILQYLAEVTFLTDAEYARADMDGDGRVNWDDVTAISLMLYSGFTKNQALRRVHSIYGTISNGTQESFYVKTRLGVNTDSPQEKVHVVWDTDVDAELGRGTTDTDITYLGLRNANGTKCYIYPNAAGNGIVVSTVKP